MLCQFDLERFGLLFFASEYKLYAWVPLVTEGHLDVLEYAEGVGDLEQLWLQLLQDRERQLVKELEFVLEEERKELAGDVGLVLWDH